MRVSAYEGKVRQAVVDGSGQGTVSGTGKEGDLAEGEEVICKTFKSVVPAKPPRPTDD